MKPHAHSINNIFWTVSFNINFKSSPVVPRPKYVFDYKNADFNELKNTLHNIPWDVSFLENDINVNLTNWEDLFWSAVKKFVPKKKVKDKLTPPWIDKEVTKSSVERKIKPAEKP